MPSTKITTAQLVVLRQLQTGAILRRSKAFNRSEYSHYLSTDSETWQIRASTITALLAKNLIEHHPEQHLYYRLTATGTQFTIITI